jgi:hypothetical protein
MLVEGPKLMKDAWSEPRKCAPSLLAFLHSIFFSLTPGFGGTFYDMAIPLLTFVIELHHEIRKVRDHGASKTPRACREIDQFLVLRPLGL